MIQTLRTDWNLLADASECPADNVIERDEDARQVRIDVVEYNEDGTLAHDAFQTKHRRAAFQLEAPPLLFPDALQHLVEDGAA